MVLHVEYNWFEREDYLPISSFNLADWAAMLQVRCHFEHASAPDRKHRLAPDAAKKLTIASDEKRRLAPIWDEYLRVALPCNYRKVPPQARMLPLLEDITERVAGLDKEEASALSALLQLRTLPPLADITPQIARLGKDHAAIHFGVRFLRVNRIVPDNHLKQAFDNWLRESPVSAPQGVSRRGRPSSNIMITSQHLKSWTAYNILGVMDLDLCATLFGVRRLRMPRPNTRRRKKRPHCLCFVGRCEDALSLASAPL